MSRAFTHEPDGDQAPDDQPERPQSPHPNYITPAGLERLRAEYAELRQAREALGEGDDALADRLSAVQLDRRLRYLHGRIERAIPVDAGTQSPDQVAFGAFVTVVDEAGGEHTFQIVGEDEADAAAGRVSWMSPLAKALMARRPGDETVWRRPAGDQALEILAIRYAE